MSEKQFEPCTLEEATHVEVNGKQAGRVQQGQRGRHCRAPVTTLGDVSVVAQTLHQHVPDLGDALHRPAVAIRLG